MKAKQLIDLLQANLAAAAAAGEDPDVIEVTLYCEEENLHNDYWEIKKLEWEKGSPTYITIWGTPQEE